jgi:hypothetical protein
LMQIIASMMVIKDEASRFTPSEVYDA